MVLHLLSTAVEIGFRSVAPGHTQQFPLLDHTSSHSRVFQRLFFSWRDEVVADAVCMWISGRRLRPIGSYARYLAARVERGVPFSPRLRRASICAIERISSFELSTSELDVVRLLNCLEVTADDTADKREWMTLLIHTIRSPAGVENLSSHYWHLLYKLVLEENFRHPLLEDFVSRGAEVTESLERVEDWEKLEIWMAIAWRTRQRRTPMEDVERVTLKLLLRRPSVLPRFEDIRDSKLQRICDWARAEQSRSMESPT